MTDLILERFWDKVSVDEETKCWNWKNALNKDGYGIFRINSNKGTILAHKFSFEVNNGKKPSNTTIDHLCINRKCVNPHHLESVSLEINQSRSKSPIFVNSIKTHCIRGHVLKGANLIEAQKKIGKRCCKACAKIRLKQYRQNKKTLGVRKGE